MAAILLAAAMAAATPALAQHAGHGIPPAAENFRAMVLLDTPLLGTQQRIHRLYTINLGPDGATPRHMHPGKAPHVFQAGQTFHPRPMTPHVARNASATAPARLTVSSITEAGRPSTILVPVTN